MNTYIFTTTLAQKQVSLKLFYAAITVFPVEIGFIPQLKGGNSSSAPFKICNRILNLFQDANFPFLLLEFSHRTKRRRNGILFRWFIRRIFKQTPCQDLTNSIWQRESKESVTKPMKQLVIVRTLADCNFQQAALAMPKSRYHVKTSRWIDAKADCSIMPLPTAHKTYRQQRAFCAHPNLTFPEIFHRLLQFAANAWQRLRRFPRL